LRPIRFHELGGQLVVAVIAECLLVTSGAVLDALCEALGDGRSRENLGTARWGAVADYPVDVARRALEHLREQTGEESVDRLAECREAQK